jgi:hypothetical protein
MTSQKTPKNAQKYYCEKCDFGCNKLSEYNRHISTPKHQILTNTYIKDAENAKAYICDCGKEYKHRQSLNNHKKKCNYTEIVEEDNKMTKTSSDDDDELSVKDVMKIVMDNQQQLLETNKMMVDVVKNSQSNITNHTTNTNSHNTINNFNMNFFLNEQCKDALNIMDFVTSVKVKMSEVENVGTLGYAEGIGRIFVRALNELDVYQRPIHCSDLKRETLYIKDENGWEKEDETNPKVKKSIRYLAHQNVKAIPEWKEVNSSWQKRHSQTEEQYYRITGNSMGACEPEGNEKNYNKIIRKVAKEVTINKSNL